VKRGYFLILALLLSSQLITEVAASALQHDTIYLEPTEFLYEVFETKPPTPQMLWLTKDLQPTIKEILGHPYKSLRIRYWKQATKSAWILEEIGKFKPITTGIVINNSKIETIKVLIYRESHGWEIKKSFFTDQFKEAELQGNLKLSQRIDGISGATLSVNALKKLSSLALYFDSKVRESN
jgi:hypothetical protein